MSKLDKNADPIPMAEFEDDQPDHIACRECKTEWEEHFIEPDGLCPLCH